MAIKLKNYKTISYLLAGIILLSASLGFLSLYSVFGVKIEGYYTDALHGDSFLDTIYKSNHILYKDLKDKTDKTSYSYSDIYLKIEVIKNELIKAESSGIESEPDYYIPDINAFVQSVKTNVDRLFGEYRNEIMDSMAQEMDYCVIDKVTGEMIKNTGRGIEDEENIKAYPYYIIINYDSAGNLGKVSVKSQYSDELLKNVQRIMKNGSWERQFSGMSYPFSYGDDEVVFYYSNLASYYATTDDGLKKASFSAQAVPKDVTFIYALTEEQMDNMYGIDSAYGRPTNSMWQERHAYYDVGASTAYYICLCILFVIAFLVVHYKKYCLHKLKIFRIPLEIVLCGGGIILSLNQMIIDTMIFTNRGYWADALYKEYLPWLSASLYPFATGLINLVTLMLVFGAWFYFSTSLASVTDLGIKDYFKERSLLIKICRRLGSFIKKYYNRFKNELLHVDLSKETGKILRKLVFVNFILLAVICSMWFFGWAALIAYTIVLYFVLKKYVLSIQEQYKRMLKATGSIAAGNLNTDMNEDLGVFESYKEELAQIQEGFKKAVEEEVKSQRMKTELITNVSHDLKTPLTAITTYIELLKAEGITEEQHKEYIDVLERKSLRLKLLIEDLFEVSKANSRNVTVNYINVDICSLMRQVFLEYEDKIEEAELIFRFRTSHEKVILKLDSQKTYRIFENLYMNIIKYAMQRTRVYIDTEKTEDLVRIELKNMSAVELQVSPEDLTERFVRGDSSRNTEGSGLGLAIAKSFTELQNGKMSVEIDGDLFKVILEWPNGGKNE